MQLAIDIGNTAIKFALFEEDKMLSGGIGIDELSQSLIANGKNISACMIASVAEDKDVIDLIRKFNIPHSSLSYKTELPIEIAYSTPETLGTDRIALAVAGGGLFGKAPILVIGAGTCITYNFINEGKFLGGAISPGITMRFQALHHYTAKLPEIDWSSYRHESYKVLTGSDSAGSILSGVLNGVVQEIDGTIEAYKSRYSGLKVAVTGGDIDFLVKNLKNDIFARPDMVLEGLNYILLQHA